MKAIQLLEAAKPLALQEIPMPEPTDEAVVVRVAGCGICHTDIGFWKDGVPTKHPLPLTLGHEVSGVVAAATPKHGNLLHREVIVAAVIPCGECELCRSGRGNICRAQLMPGNDMPGGFAEYLRVPVRGLCVVEHRDRYELSELSVVADAVTTPYQAIVRSGLKQGDVAIVVGVGGVGGYCAQIAAALGAHVVAIDVSDSRLAGLDGYGPELAINARSTDFKSLRKQVLSQAKAWNCAEYGWKIFECSGTTSGQETAFGLLGYAGTLMIVGFTLGKVAIRLSNAMAFDATIQGTWGCRPQLYPEALRLVTEHKITLKPFIQRFPMSDGPDVLTQVADHALEKRAILEPDWTP